jgi:succinylarginine dihydrolase
VLIEITPQQVPESDAVRSYLFNSQLVTLPDGTMCLVAPTECADNLRARTVIEEMLAAQNPIARVECIDVRQSMKNGGGPACLRLRVVLTQEETARTHQGIYLTESLYEDLKDWANRYYRDRLHPRDLADLSLVQESRSCLDALTQVLGLGSIYSFQKDGS